MYYLIRSKNVYPWGSRAVKFGNLLTCNTVQLSKFTNQFLASERIQIKGIFQYIMPFILFYFSIPCPLSCFISVYHALYLVLFHYTMPFILFYFSISCPLSCLSRAVKFGNLLTCNTVQLSKFTNQFLASERIQIKGMIYWNKTR
jgi:hypothetical protein